MTACKQLVVFSILFGLVAFFGWPDSAHADLTLKEYLGAVKGQNDGYKATQTAQNAFWYRESEGSLEFMPQLIGGVSYMDDRKQQSSSLYGTQTIAEGANLGVQTKLRTGTNVAFTYNAAYTQIAGSPVIPSTGYYNDYPQISISQPLWKDFNASLSKANEEATILAMKTQSLQQKYTSNQILYNAETAYWRLALLRQVVNFDKDSLERTNKILKWNQRRVNMNVADRADLLQAQAAVKLRELQYQNDVEALRQAASAFNSLRGIRGDIVPEQLTSIETGVEKIASTEVKRVADRADVTASVLSAQNQRAQAKAAAERVKPDVSVFGTAAFNGRDINHNTSMDQSWKSDFPTYTVGLKLAIPLDWGLTGDVEHGYNASAQAAEGVSWRARFELDQDWADLQKRFTDALARLNTARELEKLQEIKLDYERKRFGNGRTTSFQVLQFEDNFSEARLSRIRIINDIISLRALARLYNGESL
jgi:outer membrane protein TolC